MTQDRLVDKKAFAFAVRTVNAFRYLISRRREFVLSKQFLRAGTSIGANIAEARGAVSRRDFSNKMAIAYKECLETKYWLKLLHSTGYIGTKAYTSIFSDADELGRILYAIVKKTRPDRKD